MVKNMMNKIKEAFNERNRSGSLLLLFGGVVFLGIGTQMYGLSSTPSIKVAYEFDYCGKRAKVIVEERNLTFNRGYFLLNDKDIVRGTIISDNGETIITKIEGHTINGELKRW